MKKSVYILILLIVPLTLNAYTFTRSLTVGSEGIDVQELQKYLNSDARTKIAETGAGSPGNETTYFGNKTKEAVIKLQNLFAPLILYPVGLNTGSGFVGNSTISFLNNIQDQATTVETIMKTDEAPTVESVTPEILYDKDTITIIGKNFSPTNNTIILGFEDKDKYTNVKSTENGTKIEIEYDSQIQKTFEENYEKIKGDAKERVIEEFPEIDIAVSVITKEGQSNFKIIKFNLK